MEEEGIRTPAGFYSPVGFQDRSFSQAWVFLRDIIIVVDLAGLEPGPDGYEPSALTN